MGVDKGGPSASQNWRGKNTQDKEKQIYEGIKSKGRENRGQRKWQKNYDTLCEMNSEGQ